MKNIIDILTENGIVASKGEARMLIAIGAINVNSNLIKSKEDEFPETGLELTIQKGKKNTYKITI
jgi:tyrosyl-tRNA synthetase